MGLVIVHYVFRYLKHDDVHMMDVYSFLSRENPVLASSGSLRRYHLSNQRTQTLKSKGSTRVALAVSLLHKQSDQPGQHLTEYSWRNLPLGGTKILDHSCQNRSFDLFNPVEVYSSSFQHEDEWSCTVVVAPHLHGHLCRPALKIILFGARSN